MAKTHFFYERKAFENKLDETGNPIPLTVKKAGATPEDPETEEVVPGKFVQEEVTYTDSFNTNRVIRTHTVRKGQIVVLLDDGHEETQKTPVLKNPAKRGPITKADITEEKNRVYLQSEILLVGQDAVRFYEVLGSIEN